MSSARLLALVLRHPHPADLGRRTRDERAFEALRRLEACGLVFRRRGLYRLTTRGRNELSMVRAVERMLKTEAERALARRV
jgi:hypothetical protein